MKMRNLIFILLFGAFTSFSQISVYKSNVTTVGVRPIDKPLYDIALLNYSHLDSIEKLKKVEFGIDLEGEVEERIQLFLAGERESNYPLNPFIADDMNSNTSELSLHATFTHKATQTKKERDFFYYHDYQQINSKWSDKVNDNNNYLMRVRFAPSLPGEWNASITIQLDGNTIELPYFTFNVKNNQRSGFVKVHENKRNLELDGKVIFPIGHVFPGPYNRANGGQTPWGELPNNDPSKNTTVDDWNQFLGDIKNYINQGGKSFKLIQTSYASLIEFEELGNYQKRMHYAWEQDKILDLCEKNNVHINFNLLFQDVIMGYGQNGSGTYGDPWDYGNYGPDGPVKFSADHYPAYCYFEQGTLPSHQFLDSVLLNYHKQRTRYYVARYGYSPQIYTWELMSEPFHMNQFHKGKITIPETNEEINNEPATKVNHPEHTLAIEAINSYHNELSEYIKKELKDTDHLITLDQSIVDENPDIYPYKCAFNPSIDIIGYNYYSEKSDKLVDRKDDKNGKNNIDIEDDEKSMYKLFNDKFQQFEKPIILSESGHGATSTMNINCIGTSGNTIDAMTLGFTGIAGNHPWEGYQYGNYNQFDEKLLWPSTISSEKFMNSTSVIETLDNSSGNWTQGRQIEKIYNSNEELPKELQYYISEDKSIAVGYVRNRSYNIYTMRINDNCSLPENRDGFNSPIDEFYPFTYDQGSSKSIYNRYLYVSGLEKKSTYEISWYEFNNGEKIIQKQTIKTDGKSRFKLEFPELTLENPQRPILWFTIKQLN